MEPSPYIPEAERTRRILIERYMRLKHNYVYDSGCEKYPWLDDSAKNRYTPDVNVNNWMEERHDINYIKRHRQPLTDVSSIFNSNALSFL
ncbi:hypothetical protein TNIN_77661 [Trichonephila inaurata madagascariensis]|uniref:Uncharacterized protein n=1 Tax=Trichonephila inaurata madagascariensis TaxID=2747483 RepID=A0A8X6XW97_9ARAC|nr:hypothetical protein TNIN_77661 [Trichonephila inaurata madagascariensis]